MERIGDVILSNKCHQAFIDTLINNGYGVTIIPICKGQKIAIEILEESEEDEVSDGESGIKYKKKPAVIEAMQFTHKSKNKVYTWASSLQMNIEPSFRGGSPVLIIPTLEGEMIANIGDYIIRGVQGEFYPCKPDIFAATYEPVKESEEK